MIDDEGQATPDDWNDTSAVWPVQLSSQDRTEREQTARNRLETAVRNNQLPKAPNESWAATSTANLIGRVLIATTYSPSAEPAEIDPGHLADALTLLDQARRDVDRLEAQLIMLARHQGLTWRLVAEALGLLSPQAAAQRWTRLTGNTPPPTAGAGV